MMIKFGRIPTGSWLILVLICSLIPKPAHADNGGPVWGSFRLVADATFSPIGKVSGNTLGWSSVTINGRAAHDEQLIWNGDLITATTDTSVRVLINSLGEVTLRGGSQVRLTARIARLTDNIARQQLIASLISGDITVTLQRDAVAFIEARGSLLTTTAGAALRVEIRGTQVIAVAMTGAVKIEASGIQREYIVEAVNIEPSTGRPIGRGANTFRVPPGGIRTVSVQVMEKATKKPAGPGRRVQVALGKPGVGRIGSQSIVVLTNNFGVATATFTAGPNQDSTSVTATDEESGATWKGTIVVAKPPGIWRTRNLLLSGAAAAAVVIFKLRRDQGPIHQVPPPVIQ